MAFPIKIICENACTVRTNKQAHSFYYRIAGLIKLKITNFVDLDNYLK